MDCPDELKGDDRKVWKRLFLGLKPRNALEVEMAKRYVQWFRHYNAEAAVVAKEGSTVDYDNGTSGQSNHWKNMVEAEKQMKFLYAQLKGSIVDPQDDTDDLGQFKGL